MEPNDSEN
jgi:hypothetical protein